MPAHKTSIYELGRFVNPDSAFDRFAEKLKEIIVKVLRRHDPGLAGLPQFLSKEWRGFFAFLAREGIVPKPLRISVDQDLPTLFAFRLAQSLDSSAGDAKERVIWGSGYAEDESEALSKAVGEALERYMLAAYRHKNFKKASLDALKLENKKIFPVHELAGFADWQLERFKNRNVRTSDDFHWTEGVELLSGEKAFIPAQLVFWTYRAGFPGEPFLQERNTNGCAGHFTGDEAILAAICELIERDGFMIHWLNSISPPRVDSATIPDARIKRRTQELERSHIAAAILDITLDLEVPSFITVLINKSPIGPRIAIGGGAHLNALEAIRSSLNEALISFDFARANPPREEESPLLDDYVPFHEPLGKETRMKLYHSPKNLARASFLLNGPVRSYGELNKAHPSQEAQSPKEALGLVISKFRGKGPGYEIYAYYAEHPALDKIKYSVARAVIPALVPLYLIETNAPLGAKRIKEVPPKFGHKPSAAPNPWPHPFP